MEVRTTSVFLAFLTLVPSLPKVPLVILHAVVVMKNLLGPLDLLLVLLVTACLALVAAEVVNLRGVLLVLLESVLMELLVFLFAACLTPIRMFRQRLLLTETLSLLVVERVELVVFQVFPGRLLMEFVEPLFEVRWTLVNFEGSGQKISLQSLLMVSSMSLVTAPLP